MFYNLNNTKNLIIIYFVLRELTRVIIWIIVIFFNLYKNYPQLPVNHLIPGVNPNNKKCTCFLIFIHHMCLKYNGKQKTGIINKNV